MRQTPGWNRKKSVMSFFASVTSLQHLGAVADTRDMLKAQLEEAFSR